MGELAKPGEDERRPYMDHWVGAQHRANLMTPVNYAAQQLENDAMKQQPEMADLYRRAANVLRTINFRLGYDPRSGEIILRHRTLIAGAYERDFDE